MLFNSYIFIFVFLPLTLGSYYGLHKLGKPVFAKVALILMSFWFYGYFNPSYLWIMCSSIVVNYLLSQLLQRRWGGTISKGQLALLKKALLGIGLIFNLGLIFYFKYYDFFVDNLNKVFSTDFQLKNIVLPLGISFFTFQQVSYYVRSRSCQKSCDRRHLKRICFMGLQPPWQWTYIHGCDPYNACLHFPDLF